MDEIATKVHHALTTCSIIKQLYAEEKYWDVQLQVDKELFKCQRLLLAANSEYFDTMFSSSFEESGATRNQPITLHEMDLEAFKEILHFMYTGEIWVNDSNILQLLVTEDFLRLRTTLIRDQCFKHVKRLSEKSEPMSNAIDLLLFARLKAENISIDILSAHVCQHLHHYSNDAKILEIPFEDLNALLEFGKNFILPLSVSANVFLKIVHNWVNHDRKERCAYRCKLIENINFSKVSSDFMLLLLNRLENAADEFVKLSRELSSPAESKILGTKIEINLPSDNDAKLDGIISIVAKNLSKIEPSPQNLVLSSKLVASNLTWKVGIHRSIKNEFYVILYCIEGPSQTPTWSCYASAVFTLSSQKENLGNCVKFLPRRLFSSSMLPCCGHACVFFRWNRLFDEEKGYIKDDSITLLVHIRTDVPFCEML